MLNLANTVTSDLVRKLEHVYLSFMEAYYQLGMYIYSSNSSQYNTDSGLWVL